MNQAPSRSSFEGTYLGDDGKIGPDTRLECGICWHVYDPALGDEVAQIEPGTPFTALPDHWRCPICDAEKRQFMVLGESETRAHAGHTADPDALKIAALTQAYREANGRMRGLPVHNPALSVEAVGFGRVPGGVVGAVVTPWCLNIVFLPDGAAAAGGATVSRGFPSGPLEMMGGELQGFGPLETCSLFSPMDEFAEQEAARLAAQGAMDELMTPLAPPEPPPLSAPSRRSLFAPAFAPGGT